MKLYLPHAFTIDDGKGTFAFAAGSTENFDKTTGEMLKQRFGAVPASEAPQPDDGAKVSVSETKQHGSPDGDAKQPGPDGETKQSGSSEGGQQGPQA